MARLRDGECRNGDVDNRPDDTIDAPDAEARRHLNEVPRCNARFDHRLRGGRKWQPRLLFGTIGSAGECQWDVECDTRECQWCVRQAEDERLWRGRDEISVKARERRIGEMPDHVQLT